MMKELKMVDEMMKEFNTVDEMMKELNMVDEMMKEFKCPPKELSFFTHVLLQILDEGWKNWVSSPMSSYKFWMKDERIEFLHPCPPRDLSFFTHVLLEADEETLIGNHAV